MENWIENLKDSLQSYLYYKNLKKMFFCKRNEGWSFWICSNIYDNLICARENWHFTINFIDNFNYFEKKILILIETQQRYLLF